MYNSSFSNIIIIFLFFFFLIMRRPPRSTQQGSFPTRRSSDLAVARAALGVAEIEHRLLPGAELHPLRSEEHTSELQSRLVISYAVFCLKKKNITKYHKTSVCYMQISKNQQ